MSEVVITNVLPGAEAFRAALGAWVREQAELSARTFDSGNGQLQSGTLLGIADQVDRLDLDDQRLRALYDTHARTKAPGEGLTSFAATAKQRRLVALVGLTPANPDHDEFLAELVAVGIADLLDAITREQVARAEQEIAAEREVIKAEAAREVLRAQDAEAEALGKFHHSEAELADARKENAHLRARVGDEEPEPPKPKAQKPKATDKNAA